MENGVDLRKGIRQNISKLLICSMMNQFHHPKDQKNKIELKKVYSEGVVLSLMLTIETI